MSAMVKKFQLIEVVAQGIAGTGNQAVKFQFPDQPYLRNKPVHGIEIFNENDVTTTPQGNQPISFAQQKLSFLTIYMSDADNPQDLGEWVQAVPFSRLHNVQNNNTDTFSRMPFNLVGQRVQWEKCYITIPVAFGNVANVSFLFGVYFSEK